MVAAPRRKPPESLAPVVVRRPSTAVTDKAARKAFARDLGRLLADLFIEGKIGGT